ncbi:Crp/Fnr family transcriptional regulator [Pediococcus claussenii]|uniref:Cyclic nucleotide-binding domain protein n=1 Tax=Pediococcus claussenii (strain ATCC BAA-344 / DSM 14800 / JCM 18046 / KCTC 3811 / LMG 21948 / P06) TaxID=701521 RepID=G8PAW5_PEDCP|nr:Crp/Fnr family transcriptional regulator [Pediococcus claussenii]AEV95833.1 cyclic nucleotide-binding domain protein [Pediococcus claussenii ATCC BAA-344]ANZ69330.1 Crp/Fnr family transcriptional regulator [Pediococcus claussenii]ANZ71150.1 Crp/Fnr family transcriptional regulator [Pediococcus claussenii]
MNRAFIDRFNISTKEWSRIQHFFYEKTVPAKTNLLYEGDIADQLFFVNRGMVRLWHNHDGKDITLQFFLENQMVSSFESFTQDIQSDFSIECVEETSVSIISKSNLQLLFSQYPSFKDIMLQQITKRFIDYTKYFLSRIEDSPQERFLRLERVNPELVDRVPDMYLASYLGITPVSLSRIRHRIKN